MGALRNPQYEKFAVELSELKKPIEAYGAAGFVPHRGNAERLSRRKEVVARVRELLDEAAEFANIRRVRVLLELDRVGRANLADFFEHEMVDGKPTGRLMLRDITKLPRELTAALKSIEWDDAGKPKITLHPRNEANLALLKVAGVLPDDDTGTRRVPSIFNELTHDDQRALIEALEDHVPAGPRVIDVTPAGESGASGTTP